MNEIEKQIFRNMSAERKLELSLNLYYTARKIKEEVLKQNHPDWSKEKIDHEVKEIFLYAGT